MTTFITALRVGVIATVIALAAAAPAVAAPPSVVADACPAEAEGARCGHVDVPFERSDPSAGTIAIAFEQYRHADPGPADSAIFLNFGGPGVSVTALRDLRHGYDD